MENRKAQRYDLSLPFEVVRRGDSPTSILGETRNLSSAGVLFRSDIPFRPGDRIEYLITLSDRPDTEAPVQIYCFGKVVRSSNGSGAAATLERYEFVRPTLAQAVGRRATLFGA